MPSKSKLQGDYAQTAVQTGIFIAGTELFQHWNWLCILVPYCSKSSITLFDKKIFSRKLWKHIYIYVRQHWNFYNKMLYCTFSAITYWSKKLLKSNAANGQNLDTVQNSKLNSPTHSLLVSSFHSGLHFCVTAYIMNVCGRYISL